MMGLWKWLVMLGAVAVSATAKADCTVTSGAANLGSLSSFAVASAPTTTQANTGFRCSGGALNVLTTNTVRAVLGASSNAQGSTPRLYNAAAGRYLPYAICQDAACGSVHQLGATITWTSTSLLNLLALFNGPGGTLPLFIRPTTGIQLPRGIYTDIVPVAWSWELCSVGVLACLIYDRGSAPSSIHLTLEVLNDCFIDSAPNLDFGTAALVASFQPVTQNIQVRCTPQVTYRVGFDMGNNASAGWRRMLSGANALQYNLYIPSTTTVWDTTTTVAGTGTGATQAVPYRAAVNPAQSNVPAGTYVDTVRVILTY